MKKAKMIGKKTLSVFLAVLMVLTAWVWVAPTEASAVNAGTYDVQIKLVMSDTAALDQDETDKLILYHKVHNGTASSESTSKQTIGVDDLNQANVTYTFTGVGFPTGVKLDNIEFSQGWLSGQGTIGLTIEVYVSKNGTYTKIATSSSYSAKETNNNYFTFDYDVPQTDAPKADSIVWNAVVTTDITLSSTGSTNYTRDFKYVIKDQYGVIMSDTALSNLKTPVSYSLQSTNFPTVSNTGNIGTSSTDSPNLYHTFTNGTSEYQVSVKANDKLRSLEDGVNERKVNLKVTCGTLSSTKSFNIYDSKHTITFDKNATDASTLTPSSYKVYYGESLASQAIIDNASTYPTSGNRTGYIFLGMYDATTGGNLMNINADVTANKTYYAHWEILKYAAVFMDRSGDNVVLVESDIEHGSAATKASDATAKLNRVEFDDVNHYVLNESNVWTPSTDNVTGNTFFYPNYTATAHTFDSGIEISATCQHGAGMEYKCTGCDYSYVAETSETLGNHAKSDSYIVDTEATCETTGTGHYFCTVCGDSVETVAIPAKGHSYKSEITKYATCKELGSKKYTCTVCDYSYDEEIPLTQHNYVAGKTVAATCQHSAYTPYECSGCDASYNKYEGNATTNHNWNFTATEDTVNNTVKVTGSCSICNASFTTEEFTLSHKHNFKNYEVTKQPNCKDAGEMKISCADSGCTESYTATLPAVPTAHTEYETIYTPATCSAKGSVVTKCKDCGVTISTTEFEQLTHSYDYVRVEPTCTTAGSITKTCVNCKDVNTETIDAIGHKTVKVEANCQHGGYEKCGVCNTIISETSKKDHDFTGEVTKVEATCTVDGIKFTKCKDCDAQEPELIKSEGHKIPADFTVIIPTTCLSDGLKTKTCSKCNVVLESEVIKTSGHNHQKDEKLSVPATCETAGEDVYVCENCGDANTEVIQPSGHKWDDGVTVNATCTNSQYTTYTCQRTGCGETKIVIPDGAQALLHDFTGKETIINDATCEADGEKTVQCTRCDTTTTVIIPKLGHAYGAWDVVKEATNDEDGKWKRVCANNEDHVEYVDIPKGGHTWDNGTVTDEATCTETGTMVYKCNNSAHKDCGVTLTVTVPVKQHTIAQRENLATCKVEGSVEAYCSICKVVLSTEKIPVKAHVFEAQTAVAPTCTTSGYTPYKCNSCTESYNVYDATNPATGHDFDETIATNVTKTEATCTVDGSKKVKCKNCDVKNEVVIPKTGHSHVKDTVTAANCTTAGTEVYKCACGDTYTKFIEAAKGHTFGGWTVTQAATADQYGIQERTCSVCKTVEIDKVAPIGNHTFVEKVTKEATCTEKGEKSFTCSAHENCSANYTAEIPAKGHTQTLVYEEPTCTAIGYSKVVCSVGTCKALIMSAEIPAKGHTYNTVKVTTEAGCESTGIRTYSCSCGASYIETIPAKGHTYKTEVNYATCENKGSVVTTCENCTAYSETKILAALNHKWNEGEFEEGDAPTCTSTGTKTYTCTVAGCGKTKTETVKALGHNWGDWEVTPSTNNATGSVSRKCLADNCDGTETITIPAGGHNLVVDEVNSSDATCTGEGTLVYKCENHIDCGITVSVTVPMIQHKLETKTEKEVSCTEDGKVVTKCTSCKNAIVETIIPAKGHIVTVTTTPATCIKEGSVVEDCDNCDYKVTTPLLMIPHDYRGEEINKVDATCTADGSKTIQCKTEGCTATTTVIIPHTGHTWNAWTITKPATNTADGEMTRTCSNGTCTETVVIPKGGHIWDNGTVTKDATCTETGTMVYKCNNADHGNCTASYEVAISIKEHTIAQREIESTCKVEGSVEAYCSKCNRVLSTETIPVKAHVYKAGTAVAPTCTTSGYTPYKCSCGDTYNVYDATKPAKGHSLVEGTSTATCTEGGVMTLKCENCTYSTTVNVPALGHNYVENEKAETKATCAAAATKTYECSRCTASYTISVGEKLTNYDAHQWTAWITVESATNTSLGYKTRTCEVCNKMEVETIAATGEHNFNTKTAETPATCTSNGSVTYACSTDHNCGLTSTVTIPATGHTEKHEYKAATCKYAGYSRMYCEICKEGLSKEIIPTLAHDWNVGKVVKQPTCTSRGSIELTCSRGCETTYVTAIPTNYNAHQFEMTVDKSTCTSAGGVITECKLCGYIVTKVTFAQLEHTWDEGTETKAATCLVKGETTYECTVENCDATKTEDIPALGHSWGKWEETKASTNGENGILTRTCLRGCTETAEIPAGGHKFENAPVINNAASCTAVGSATYKCSAHENCGVEVDVVLPMLQHKLEKSEQAASCDTAGFVTVKCKNCDTATYTTVIPKTGCAWNEGEITKAATCTEEGTMTFTCAYNADHKYTKQIAKTQHDYVEGTPVAATCTSNGYTPYKCKTCDSSYVILDAAAPAKGHTFNTVVSSTANCTDGGVMTLKCACGKTMETQVPALGHDYQFSVATMATCAEAATETFKCSRCADSYTVSVGSKTNNHDWNDWVIVKATNTSLGYQTRTCKACDKLEFEIIPATGEHKFDTETNDKKAATCTEDGYVVYACSTHDDCGLTSKVTIPAKGHTEQLMYSAPSCTKEGSTSIYCDVCKTTIVSEKLDKLDHTFEVESIKNATCKDEGLISFKCKCGKTKSQTIAVDSTAHKLKTTVNLATCKEAGSVTVICENGCTYKEETAIPKLQHSWGEWKVTTASTNSTDGEMTRYCGSGCSETVKIPAGGHAFGDTPDSTTPASCTAEGTATYNCTAHTNCGVTITVKTEKLQHTLVTDSKASNCTESGYVKVYCSECKKEYSNMTFGKLAHDYTVVVEKFDATCTTAGHTILKCVNCDAKYDRFDAQPNGHEYKDEKAIVETKPTCTKMGYTTYTCDICRSSYTTNFVNPTGHKYTSVVTAPTCTESGYTTYTCTCGESYISNPVSPTGHNFDEKIEGNVTIVSADCEADGLKTVKCKSCDTTNVTVLPATGHDYDVNNDGKINLDDAEMIDGEFVYVCQNAGCSHKVKAEDDEDDTDSFTVRFFDGNGEQVGEDRIVLAGEKATAPETATKTADNNYHYTFSGWDRDFSKIDKDLDVYATFEREAHYGGEAVCYAKAVCDKCGVGYGEFDATKHIIVTKSKSATCEADGWIEYYCSVEICGYHYSTGNYLKKETIGASGHVYGKWTIVQNGTCEIPQIQQRRCVNVGCNKIDEKRTQSTHTWMIEPKINPTCSSVGYTEFKYCLTCNLQIDRVEIPKTDHKDLDGNGYCDYCGTSKGTPKCNCMCHSTGIMKLFYGIVKFFWKLTKSSRSCSCGAVHY